MCCTIAATTQIRLDTPGRAHYRRKIADGKTRMELRQLGRCDRLTWKRTHIWQEEPALAVSMLFGGDRGFVHPTPAG
jgi:hypothetical protein